MTQTPQASNENASVALIVGGGPGISASCARLFTARGLRVAVAARDPDKPVMQELEQECGAMRFACDAAEPASVSALFDTVVADLGSPRLVVHNIDGRSMEILRKPIADAEPALVQDVLNNAAYSAFLVGQQAARCLLNNAPDETGRR